MKCWICNVNEADSGEHMFKASDVRRVFGEISGNKPIYKHDSKNNNKRVHGADSNKLKFQDSLCKYCNNERTQPHDLAWQKLSEYLQSHWNVIKNNNGFNLGDVFISDPEKQFLSVHLYFLKQFGCRIVEAKIPAKLSEFSKSIMNDSAHPDVRLVFFETPKIITSNFIKNSDIEAICDNEKDILVSVVWTYSINKVTVRIEYVNQEYARKFPLYEYCHPSITEKFIGLGSDTCEVLKIKNQYN